jgi:hypothetical protein
MDGLVADRRPLPAESFGRKLRAVRDYRSQIAGIEGAFGPIDDPRLLGCEVVWRPPAATG